MDGHGGLASKTVTDILTVIKNTMEYARYNNHEIGCNLKKLSMKDGKFIGARTPYGYLKAEDDCYQLIVDLVAAVVVRQMFQWAQEGARLNTIAVRLNEQGVLPPSHYKKMQGTAGKLLHPEHTQRQGVLCPLRWQLAQAAEHPQKIR